jgi:DNA-binding Xre family transcriptional regulator
MIIESKIDEVLETKGISVDDLVNRTGLTRMTIFNARKGANVTLKTALIISEVLGVALESIWSSETDNKEQEPAGADISTM